MELKIFNILTDNVPVEICALYKLFPTQRKEVSSAISQLAIKGEVITFTRKGKLWIVKQLIQDKKKADTKQVFSLEGTVELTPKIGLKNMDWVVREKGDNKTLYFDGKFTRDQVRSAFKKITECEWHLIRTCRYEKQQTLREARNNY